VRTGKITERWRDKKWNMKIQFLTHGYNKELSKFNMFAIKELQCPAANHVRVHILASKDMAGGGRTRLGAPARPSLRATPCRWRCCAAGHTLHAGRACPADARPRAADALATLALAQLQQRASRTLR
jgi:hypothetical protein